MVHRPNLGAYMLQYLRVGMYVPFWELLDADEQACGVGVLGRAIQPRNRYFLVCDRGQPAQLTIGLSDALSRRWACCRAMLVLPASPTRACTASGSAPSFQAGCSSEPAVADDDDAALPPSQRIHRKATYVLKEDIS